MDLTSDESLTGDDLGVLGQMMQMQQGGGGGCGEEDPFCQFQRVVEIAYDYRNQMVQYKDLDQMRTHRYHYDCFGRRVAKVVDHQAGGGQVTRFVYGGQASWQVLAEYETFQPAEGNPAIASFVYGNYIDEPIQARRDFDAGGPGATQDFYYHPDELFNVVAVTNVSGTVIERVRYGDYGNPTVTDASGSPISGSTIGNRFAFTGREYDGETQFSCYRTRYLHHAWGRFTTRDRIGTWGDPGNAGSALSLVGSSPASRPDPYGLAPPLFWPIFPTIPHLYELPALDDSLKTAHKNLSAHDEGRTGIFARTQSCILNSIGACAKNSQESAWLAQVARDFMNPLLQSMRQRAAGSPVTAPHWDKFFNSSPFGTPFGPSTMPQCLMPRHDGLSVDIPSLFREPYDMAVSHIDNDLQDALRRNGKGGNGIWKCIGDKVRACSDKMFGSTMRRLAAFSGYDVDGLRDRMRDRLPGTIPGYRGPQ